MKTLIISYSFTGNNATLSTGLSRQIQADHYQVSELKKRSLFTIVLDVIFNRTPDIQNSMPAFEAYDHLILIAPVWMGMAASPVRKILKEIQSSGVSFSFVSFSAGADGENPNLSKDLEKRTGLKPTNVINPLIRSIHPKGKNASRKELDAYRLKEPVASDIINRVAKQLQLK